MGRPLLGALIGVVMALSSVAVATMWFGKEPERLYLRIADDNFDHILGPDYKAEDGPVSVKLIRHCGIDEFTTISALPDYAGSSLVPLDSTSEGEINCLIGEARIHALSLAIAAGPDEANFECLPGWPSRFQPFNASDYELCRGHKPDAIFRSTKDDG
ncbi:MAG: hypothetical protein JHC57_06470 [Sphingopyxis sp.]|uniref:hypothetical protein n=1 Tax=Sphingopyxis sp. TaxID=1908224 RepID=UPI001A1D887B|nr:hypothetical protein [Sphingopyxis sp.]MBJ7499378.1 hypothetical protein [Sphingopyxis sp.]